MLAALLLFWVACNASSPGARDRDQSSKGAIMDDSQTIQQLVADLDKDEDPLHMDVTPSVHKLGSMGIKVIPYLEKPLASSSETTRLRAGRALERALETHYGFVPGRGFVKEGGEQQLRELWKQVPPYRHDAPEDERRAAIARWTEWYGKQPAGGAR